MLHIPRTTCNVQGTTYNDTALANARAVALLLRPSVSDTLHVVRGTYDVMDAMYVLMVQIVL